VCGVAAGATRAIDATIMPISFSVFFLGSAVAFASLEKPSSGVGKFGAIMKDPPPPPPPPPTCTKWQAGAACTLDPWHIRDTCMQSYNPTVGTDHVSGSNKITDTFPVAPGLATKNSAVNFLKGTGYDPVNFGRDILKYTYNAEKLWSVGAKNFALPDTVSVYTAAVACSLVTQTMTSATASSADASSSESTSWGAAYSKSVDVEVKKGPVKAKSTLKTQIGFGRSSGTGNYQSNAREGRSELHQFRARAVSYTATISTKPLTTCDMNEYFVYDVLLLAKCLPEERKKEPEGEQSCKLTAADVGSELSASNAIDVFLATYGTHLPVKFELGCEVSRTFSFAATMEASSKQASLQKASSAGFQMFGFGDKTETSGSNASSIAATASEQEAQGATQITCGSGAPTLQEFCDSVVMNNDQSHIPKMLSVDELVPVWSIMEQVDPWVGETGTAEDPEIDRASIKNAAAAVKARFEELTSAGADNECTTAGSLEPPSESGVCAFTGNGWDCSTCSCYNTNFDPENPNATPESSCSRSACTPDLFMKFKKPPPSHLALIKDAPADSYSKFLTLDKCHKKCLQYPVSFGSVCHGFWFQPYDEKTWNTAKPVKGECLLYSTTFTTQEAVTTWNDYKENDGAAYYQYSPHKNGCDPNFTPTQEKKDRTCIHSPGKHSVAHVFASPGKPPCFQECDARGDCVAAEYYSGRCNLYYKDCLAYSAFESEKMVKIDDGRVLKLWCGRASAYKPISTHADAEQCAADGLWYSCSDPNCVAKRACASAPRLDVRACACPGGPTLTVPGGQMYYARGACAP
jgi:hypothetical protein